MQKLLVGRVIFLFKTQVDAESRHQGGGWWDSPPPHGVIGNQRLIAVAVKEDDQFLLQIPDRAAALEDIG